MDAKKLAVITSIVISQTSKELFKNSQEVTITKKYFEEVVAKQIISDAADTIMKALELMNLGMPAFIAVIIAKTENDLSKTYSDNQLNISEHMDCENCEKSETCEIKELMMKLNVLKNNTSDSDNINTSLSNDEEILKDKIKPSTN